MKAYHPPFEISFPGMLDSRVLRIMVKLSHISEMWTWKATGHSWDSKWKMMPYFITSGGGALLLQFMSTAKFIHHVFYFSLLELSNSLVPRPVLKTQNCEQKCLRLPWPLYTTMVYQSFPVHVWIFTKGWIQALLTQNTIHCLLVFLADNDLETVVKNF